MPSPSRKNTLLPTNLFAATAPAPAPAPEPEPPPSARTPAVPRPTRLRRQTAAAALDPRPYTSGGPRPAADLLDVAPVRFSAYLRPAQLLLLRQEAGARQQKGHRVDVSLLLREAVDCWAQRRGLQLQEEDPERDRMRQLAAAHQRK